MGALNEAGIRFIHDRVGELAVNDMDAAADVIANALPKRRAGQTDTEFGRHLAWLIGFDRLIDDRKEIHRVTSLVVTPKGSAR